MNKPTN